jgi:hypothetical protein
MKKLIMTMLVMLGVLAVGMFGWSQSQDEKTFEKEYNLYLKKWMEKEPAPQRAQPTIEYHLTASELYAEYKANVLRADSRYKGKFVEVTGVIESIGKEILGRPYITLKIDDSGWGSVQCVFPKSEIDSLIQFSPGQSVKVVGKVLGETLGIVLLTREL